MWQPGDVGGNGTTTPASLTTMRERNRALNSERHWAGEGWVRRGVEEWRWGYCVWEIKSFSFLCTLTLLSERMWKKALISNTSLRKKHSSRLNPAVLNIIKSIRLLYTYLEIRNLPSDFWKKNYSKEEKAVAHTRMLMTFVHNVAIGWIDSIIVSNMQTSTSIFIADMNRKL